MANPIAFYAKCRPQNVDAWPIVQAHRVVFVGYPPWKGSLTDPEMRTGYKAAIFDISQDPACASLLSDQTRGYRAQVSLNANLVAAVTPGSFVIVPRPDQGVCHIGRVGRFDISDAPEWADEYLRLRQEAHLEISPAATHIGDIIQCWTVEKWQTVSFPLIPRWITYRLLSRNTAGVIYGLPDLGLDAYACVASLFSNVPSVPERARSTEAALMEWVSPSTFEHLVVHLLQLEAMRGERWHHVGGSGDGGVDGLAVTTDGTVVGALQCKWHYQGEVARLTHELARIRCTWPNAQLVIAVLLSPSAEPSMLPDGVMYLGLSKIASLVEKHREKLPLALSLGLHAR